MRMAGIGRNNNNGEEGACTPQGKKNGGSQLLTSRPTSTPAIAARGRDGIWFTAITGDPGTSYIVALIVPAMIGIVVFFVMTRQVFSYSR